MIEFNKKTNKIIAAMIILVVFIIIIILSIIYFNSRSTINEQTGTDRTSPEEINVNKSVVECEVANEYFVVKDIVNKYYKYSGDLDIKADNIEVYRQAINEEEMKKYKEEKAKERKEIANEMLYNMLNSTYIKEFDIKKDDLKKKFSIGNNEEIVIRKMYKIESSENVSTFLVNGIIIENENNKIEKYNIAVSLDMFHNTFSIFPEEYLKKYDYDDVNVGESIDITIDSIESNNYNEFEYKTFIDDSEIAKDYFNNYRYNMIYDVSYAYNMLDKEYREKRFGSLDGYKAYIQENYDEIVKCIISKYQVTEEDNQKEYICIDDYGNYYIFIQNNMSNYELQLDTYTIESKSFLNKYTNGDDQTKSGINVEKFFEALNRKDYQYIYNHLAESFRNNYFDSEERLKEYIQKNLFVYSKVDYKDYKKEGNVNIFKVKILNNEDSQEEKEMTIMIQLKEDNNFIMSFSIE